MTWTPSISRSFMGRIDANLLTHIFSPLPRFKAIVGAFITLLFLGTCEPVPALSSWDTLPDCRLFYSGETTFVHIRKSLDRKITTYFNSYYILNKDMSKKYLCEYVGEITGFALGHPDEYARRDLNALFKFSGPIHLLECVGAPRCTVNTWALYHTFIDSIGMTHSYNGRNFIGSIYRDSFVVLLFAGDPDLIKSPYNDKAVSFMHPLIQRVTPRIDPITQNKIDAFNQRHIVDDEDILHALEPYARRTTVLLYTTAYWESDGYPIACYYDFKSRMCIVLISTVHPLQGVPGSCNKTLSLCFRSFEEGEVVIEPVLPFHDVSRMTADQALERQLHFYKHQHAGIPYNKSNPNQKAWRWIDEITHSKEYQYGKQNFKME